MSPTPVGAESGSRDNGDHGAPDERLRPCGPHLLRAPVREERHPGVPRGRCIAVHPVAVGIRQPVAPDSAAAPSRPTHVRTNERPGPHGMRHRPSPLLWSAGAPDGTGTSQGLQALGLAVWAQRNLAFSAGHAGSDSRHPLRVLTRSRRRGGALLRSRGPSASYRAACVSERSTHAHEAPVMASRPEPSRSACRRRRRVHLLAGTMKR
jgi:hypothetical protein